MKKTGKKPMREALAVDAAVEKGAAVYRAEMERLFAEIIERSVALS